MRFLFECVSCYGTARMDPPTEESSMSAVEETRRLVSPHTVGDAVAAVRTTLRRRGRSLARLGPGDWKPSLHAIAEDNVVAPVKARANKAAEQMTRAAATARRSGKRCAPSTPSVHSRGRGDSYRLLGHWRIWPHMVIAIIPMQLLDRSLVLLKHWCNLQILLTKVSGRRLLVHCGIYHLMTENREAIAEARGVEALVCSCWM